MPFFEYFKQSALSLHPSEALVNACLLQISITDATLCYVQSALYHSTLTKLYLIPVCSRSVHNRCYTLLCTKCSISLHSNQAVVNPCLLQISITDATLCYVQSALSLHPNQAVVNPCLLQISNRCYTLLCTKCSITPP